MVSLPGTDGAQMSERKSFTYAQLCAAAAAVGLACRGGFHPKNGDGVPVWDEGCARTVVLLGFTGSAQWPVFAASPEHADGAPHPLDRWSQRIIDDLARGFGARALYPFGGPPWWPFQRWAQRAEHLHLSPLRVLIHPEYGLWHAYRGALLFSEMIELPPLKAWSSPCESCREQPCLSACPAGALADGQFLTNRCLTHLVSTQGLACRTGGCLARYACPFAASHRYDAEHAAFHLRAFTAARR